MEKYRNYFYEFKEHVKKHPTFYGWEIHKIFDMVEKDFKNFDLNFNLEAGNKAIEFINKFCLPANEKLTNWQTFLVFCMYAIQDKNKIYHYEEFFIIVGRGNGKTPFMATIMAYDFINKNLQTKEFYGYAPQKILAKKLFVELGSIVKKELWKQYGFKARGTGEDKAITNNLIDKFICTLNTYSTENMQSLNYATVVIDEVHLLQDTELYFELQEGAKRDNSRTISISSGGKVDNGLYDYLTDRSENKLNGNTEHKIFPLIFKANNISNWYKEEEIRKANPSWDNDFFNKKRKSIMASVDEILNESEIKKATFFRYVLNLKVNGSTKFFQFEDFDYNMSFNEKEILKNKDIKWFIGIDLGYTRDLSTYVIMGRNQKNKETYLIQKSFTNNKIIKTHKEKSYFPWQSLIKSGEVILAGDEANDNSYVWEHLKSFLIENRLNITYVGYDPNLANELQESFRKSNWKPDQKTTAIVTSPYNITASMVALRQDLIDRKLFCNSEFLKMQFLQLDAIEVVKNENILYKPDNKNQWKLHDTAVASFYTYLTEYRWKKRKRLI